MSGVAIKNRAADQLICLAQIRFESTQKIQFETALRLLQLFGSRTFADELLNDLIDSRFDLGERVLRSWHDYYLIHAHVLGGVLKSKHLRGHLRIVNQRFRQTSCARA